MKTFQLKLVIVVILLIVSFGFMASAQSKENEAAIIFNSGGSLDNLNAIIKHSGKDKNVKDQAYAMKIYTEPLAKKFKGVKMRDKYAINNFIVYGTKSTKFLPAKERLALVKSYQTKYNKLPLTEADWNKVLKLSQSFTKCSSMNCFTKLTPSCRKGEYTYTFSNYPFPLFDVEGLTVDGKTYFKINGVNNDGLCSLTQQALKTVFIMSQQGRQAAIKNGLTDEQVTTQLKAMNDATKEESYSKDTLADCTGTGKNITTYLTNIAARKSILDSFSMSLSCSDKNCTSKSTSYGVTCKIISPPIAFE